MKIQYNLLIPSEYAQETACYIQEQMGDPMADSWYWFMHDRFSNPGGGNPPYAWFIIKGNAEVAMMVKLRFFGENLRIG